MLKIENNKKQVASWESRFSNNKMEGKVRKKNEFQAQLGVTACF